MLAEIERFRDRRAQHSTTPPHYQRSDMSWHHQPFVAFDLETTGIDPETARIVTADCLRIDPVSGEKHPLSWLVNPGIEIPEETTRVHGISTEHARTHGADPAQSVREIMTVLRECWANAQYVVAYNAPYDLTVLDREMQRHGLGELSTIVGYVVDPLVLDRALDRYRSGSRKLQAVCGHYDIELTDEDAHTSGGDALAAGRLAWVLAARYADEIGGDSTLDTLHQAQQWWYRDWAISFADYLRRRKQDDGASQDELDAIHVPDTWPLHPRKVTSAAR